MREANEVTAWKKLKAKHASIPPAEFQIDSVTLDLSAPCHVIGGRNGAGKSRVLRAIRDEIGDSALLLDLHHLCEQALMILRSREDFPAMKEETGPSGPGEERRFDVTRVVGRKYDQIDWYALEVVEFADPAIAAKFLWDGDAAQGDLPLVPYFEATYKNVEYSSRDMGLGEFSAHFLFWILEQYKGRSGLTLLLDEPDAFLPPVGAASLLYRLLLICLERDWKLIVATHSSEMISVAAREDAFVLLRMNSSGLVEGRHCRDDPGLPDTLLAEPPVRRIFFVEDESAWILTTVLLEALDRRLLPSTAIIWGKGAGYMGGLQKHFPRPPGSPLTYGYIFDGDQRDEVRASGADRWPAFFLPTDDDPDDLFRSCEEDVSQLAYRLNVPVEELTLFLDSIEGRENHDWVNDLGERYGRQKVLRVLAEMWSENHADERRDLLDQLGSHVRSS